MTYIVRLEFTTIQIMGKIKIKRNCMIIQNNNTYKFEKKMPCYLKGKFIFKK